MRKQILSLLVVLLIGSTVCMAQDRQKGKVDREKRIEQIITDLGLNEKQAKDFKAAMEEREKNNVKLKNIDKIIYGILLGGIIGNLIDRVLYGYVIDYLSFNIFGYSFPIFNFADICIVLSMIGLIIWSCIGGKNG